MTLYKNTYRVDSSRLKDWDYSNDAAYFVTICTHGMKNYFGKVNEDKIKLSAIGKIVEEEWRRTGELRKNVMLDEYKIMPNHVHGILMIFNDDKIAAETTRRVVSNRETDISDIVEMHRVRLTDEGSKHAGDAHRAMYEDITVETTRRVVSNRETDISDIVETHRVRLTDEGSKHAGDAHRASLQNIIKGFKSTCTSRIHTLGFKNFKWQSRYYDRIIRNEKELFNVRQYIMDNPIKWTFDEYYSDED